MLPRERGRRILIVAALAFVAVAVFQPHYNLVTREAFPYPAHADEFVHWASAREILSRESVNIGDPFSGSEPPPRYTPASDERGFQTMLAVFVDATGVDWVSLFVWGPSVVAALIGLALYALLSPYDVGIESILLVAAIPTTIRFLGPAYLVPIVLGGLFLIATLLVLEQGKGVSRALLVALLLVVAWTIHMVAAAGILLASLAYAVACLRRDFRFAMALILAASLPMIAVLGFLAASYERGVDVSTLLTPRFEILRMFGYATLALSLVGLGGGLASRRTRPLATALGALALGTGAVLLVKKVQDIDFFGLYDRSWMILFFAAVALAALGLATLRKGALALVRRARRGQVARAARIVSAATILASAGLGGASYEATAHEPWIRFLNDDAYATFASIATDVPAKYDRAVVYPSTYAMAFTAVTGRPAIYTLRPTSPAEDPIYLRDFIRNNAPTSALVGWKASLVYTVDPVTNPDLALAYPDAYLLREDYVDAFNPSSA